MQHFARALGVTSATRVLDVGGTLDCWELLPAIPQVTVLNLPSTKPAASGIRNWVVGDGLRLPFADESFEIVFSNSVIEHVGDADKQRRFAQEIARVGRCYWVQTPNRWFPIEQHLLTPFIHWLPRSWQKKIVPRWTIWGELVTVASDQRRFFLEHYLNDIRLLDSNQLQDLFPDARIVAERVLGWTKSLVAVKANPA